MTNASEKSNSVPPPASAGFAGGRLGDRGEPSPQRVAHALAESAADQVQMLIQGGLVLVEGAGHSLELVADQVAARLGRDARQQGRRRNVGGQAENRDHRDRDPRPARPNAEHHRDGEEREHQRPPHRAEQKPDGEQGQDHPRPCAAVQQRGDREDDPGPQVPGVLGGARQRPPSPQLLADRERVVAADLDPRQIPAREPDLGLVEAVEGGASRQECGGGLQPPDGELVGKGPPDEEPEQRDRGQHQRSGAGHEARPEGVQIGEHHDPEEAEHELAQQIWDERAGFDQIGLGEEDEPDHRRDQEQWIDLRPTRGGDQKPAHEPEDGQEDEQREDGRIRPAQGGEAEHRHEPEREERAVQLGAGRYHPADRRDEDHDPARHEQPRAASRQPDLAPGSARRCPSGHFDGLLGSCSP